MEEATPEAKHHYPWYTAVRDDTLEQGDFLFRLPVYFPVYPEGLPLDPQDFEAVEAPAVPLDIGLYDAIVVTQSCDLTPEQDAPLTVVICPVFPVETASEFHKSLKDRGGLNDVRKGRVPGLHMLNACKIPEFDFPIQIVFFHQVMTVPHQYVRSAVEYSVARNEPRLRLMPPYREHMAQAFARFIMRIGLPDDIPPFEKRPRE